MVDLACAEPGFLDLTMIGLDAIPRPGEERLLEPLLPASANQQMTFVWDRLDVYGRQMLGGQTLNVKIDYNYPSMYQEPGPLPSAFNSVSGVTLGANPSRQQIAISAGAG